jgi:hypothetical protein
MTDFRTFCEQGLAVSDGRDNRQGKTLDEVSVYNRRNGNVSGPMMKRQNKFPVDLRFVICDSSESRSSHASPAWG